jgi:hypothetical protein
MFVDPCIIIQFTKKKIQQNATIYQNFIIPYLYEAQNVSGDTPLIIRLLDVQTVDYVHRLHVQQPLTYKKPEAASAVLGSC